MNEISIKHTKELLNKKVEIPSSKSQSQRAILLGAMAMGKSAIYSPLSSPDTEAMINGASLMGAKILLTKDGIYIDGVGGKPITSTEIIDARNSGQVFRFLTAMLALGEGTYYVTGDESIKKNRPIIPLVEALRSLGAVCEFSKGTNQLPLKVKGPIKAGTVSLNGEDSQPVSALLMALSFVEGKSEIVVENSGETSWIDLTLSWLDRMSIQYENDRYRRYIVYGDPEKKCFSYSVPGDFSSALFPIVSAIVTNSSLTIEGLDFTDAQGDKETLTILEKMGANIEIDQERKQVTVYPSDSIEGIEIDINPIIDALPIFAVLGCYAKGKTTIYNGKIARKKESDRIAAISRELQKMGAMVEEKEDGLIIHHSSLVGTSVDGNKDHRIVMSLFVAGLFAKGKTTLSDCHYVNKSYPTFFEQMKNLGVNFVE